MNDYDICVKPVVDLQPGDLLLHLGRPCIAIACYRAHTFSDFWKICKLNGNYNGLIFDTHGGFIQGISGIEIQRDG